MISRRSAFLTAAPFLLSSSLAYAEILLPRDGDQTAALQNAIDAAVKGSGVVVLGAGVFNVGTLTISGNVSIQGVPGATQLKCRSGGNIFTIGAAEHVVLQGIGLSAKGETGTILSGDGVERLVIESCDFSGADAGMRVSKCGGRIVGNHFQFHNSIGCQLLDSKGFTISENQLSDIGNCGIQVWQTDPREDGSIISENHISRIASRDGGNGQNGNGINVYKAGSVTVSNNRISDCVYSAIRNNSGENSIIVGNSISRCNEVALYVEFAHEGAVVANNLVDTAAHGIQIVNLDVGGRLSQCTGNVLRNLKGKDEQGAPMGGGILCDADIIVANNVIDKAALYGIRLGWGPYGRNLQANNNMMIDCRRGIEFSTLSDGPTMITNNIISGATAGAIVGMDYEKVATEDLALAGTKVPDRVNISGNMIRN
jgi:uncharacterized secreted repeat protein (TIGR03808 family)